MHMKFFLSGFLVFFALSVLAQNPNITPDRPNPFQVPMNNTPNSEWFKDRKTMYFLDQFYVIEGRQVYGSPFLMQSWHTGSVTTADGRVFNGYKLKYNAYHQTVYFSNGADSLEVNEEIREFTIDAVYPDTTIHARFINGNQFRKEKKTVYYEVLLDNPRGQLLKLNRKIVTTPEKGVNSVEGRKIFQLEVAYFYFDKQKKAFTEIKPNGSNVVSVLQLDPATKDSLQPENVNFLLEPEVINFFQRYFRLGPGQS